MFKELTNIKFLPMCDKSKVCFDSIYKCFSNNPLFNVDFKNFVSTNITGIYDNTFFLLYKDYKNTNRFCIVFFEGANHTIICIDSDDCSHYFDGCNYYSELNSNNFFIETHGLGVDSINYCKFNMDRNGTTYSICLCNDEVIDNNITYKYEMTLKNSVAESSVSYLWNSYVDFINGRHPLNIKLYDKVKCIKSNFIMTNYDCYNAGDGRRTYEYISSLISSLGIISYDNSKDYIKHGINVHDGIVQILERYLGQRELEGNLFHQHEQYSKNREKIVVTVSSQFDDSELTTGKKM